MGQKSRQKKTRHTPSRPQTTARQETGNSSPSLVTSTAPSLVQTSAAFRPKGVAAASEDLLQVRSGDIRRIGILLSITLVLFIALAVINAKTNYLENAGHRLATFMKI